MPSIFPALPNRAFARSRFHPTLPAQEAAPKSASARRRLGLAILLPKGVLFRGGGAAGQGSGGQSKGTRNVPKEKKSSDE